MSIHPPNLAFQAFLNVEEPWQPEIILSQKFPGFLTCKENAGKLGNPRIKWNDHHVLKSLQGFQAFLNRNSLEGMEYFLLAFPRNPRIKEEPRVLEIIPVRSSIQAFLHVRKSLESVVTFLKAVILYTQLMVNVILWNNTWSFIS